MIIFQIEDLETADAILSAIRVEIEVLDEEPPRRPDRQARTPRVRAFARDRRGEGRNVGLIRSRISAGVGWI